MTGGLFDIPDFLSLPGDLGAWSYFGDACASAGIDVRTCGRGPIFEEMIGSSYLDLDVERGVPESST